MKTFPELRAAMAREGLTYEDMAKVMGLHLRTFVNKINGTTEFHFDEMLAAREYFITLGYDYSVEGLFFAWKFAKANKAE